MRGVVATRYELRERAAVSRSSDDNFDEYVVFSSVKSLQMTTKMSAPIGGLSAVAYRCTEAAWLSRRHEEAQYPSIWNFTLGYEP